MKMPLNHFAALDALSNQSCYGINRIIPCFYRNHLDLNADILSEAFQEIFLTANAINNIGRTLWIQLRRGRLGFSCGILRRVGFTKEWTTGISSLHKSARCSVFITGQKA